MAELAPGARRPRSSSAPATCTCSRRRSSSASPSGSSTSIRRCCRISPGAQPIEDVLEAGRRRRRPPPCTSSTRASTPGRVVRQVPVPVEPRETLVDRDPGGRAQAAARGGERALRALISVYDKTGLDGFAKGLASLDWELVASGGTAAFLEELGLSGHDGRVDHRVPGAARRAREDAPSAHPRGHPRPAGPSRTTWRRSPGTGSSPSSSSASTSTRSRRLPARHGVREEDAVEMIDVGGPVAPARRCEELRARRARLPAGATTTPFSTSCAGDGSLSAETRRRLAATAFATHRRVRGRHRRLVRRPGAVPGRLRPRLREAARSRVRREPAPGRRLLRRARRPHAPARPRRPAARPRALVQQPERPQRRTPPRARVHPPGVRDRQARESRAASRSGRRSRRRTRARSPPTRSRRTAASSSSTARSAQRSALRLAEQFVEVLFAPGYDQAAIEALVQKPGTRILNDLERRAVEPGERDLKRVLGGAARPEPRLGRGRPRGHEGRVRRARRRRSGATCSSPGGSASTSPRTRSCSRKTFRRSASAPAR